MPNAAWHPSATRLQMNALKAHIRQHSLSNLSSMSASFCLAPSGALRSCLILSASSGSCTLSTNCSSLSMLKGSTSGILNMHLHEHFDFYIEYIHIIKYN